MSLNEVFLELKSGDQSHFNWFYENSKKQLFYNILSYTKNYELSEDLLQEDDFISSYIEYINTLIHIQNENFALSRKRKKEKIKSSPPSVSQKIKLKNILQDNGYDLVIPIQYLNSNDMDSIISYIQTGDIELGSERIYNYIRKTNIN